MEKILVVFTGGTICTTIQGKTMETDPSAPAALIEFYKKSDSYCKDAVEFEPGKMFGILSENMTVHQWNKLIDYFQQKLPECTGHRGIIIAHGTDTLAYTAALFSQLLKGIPIPVIFVSSNRPILDKEGYPNPDANGSANFRAAVECIHERLQPGVYATYQNPKDQRMYLHKGAHLLQCAIYDDNFYSVDALDITAKTPLIQKKSVSATELPIFTMGKARLSDCILKINPYVGLNYEMLDPAKAKAVLHGTYHSGTACVECDEARNSILSFFEKCAAADIPFYYAPAQTGEEATVYASVPLIENHKAHGQQIRFHYGMTEELLYAKLLLAYSLGWPEEQIRSFLKEE